MLATAIIFVENTSNRFSIRKKVRATARETRKCYALFSGSSDYSNRFVLVGVYDDIDAGKKYQEIMTIEESRPIQTKSMTMYSKPSGYHFAYAKLGTCIVSRPKDLHSSNS